jgi:hypothetical protein
MLLSFGNTCIVLHGMFVVHVCAKRTWICFWLTWPKPGLQIIVITGVQFQFLLYWDGPSWSWSYGSWIYNYPCNQCLSPLKFYFLSCRCVLGTTLCDRVCKWLAEGQWFCLWVLRFPPPIKLTITIIKILLKVALSTITLAPSKILTVHPCL